MLMVSYLFTSTGVILCIAVQWCISAALAPRGVHHFRVTVSYSQPSRCVRTRAVSWAFPEQIRRHIRKTTKVIFWCHTKMKQAEKERITSRRAQADYELLLVLLIVTGYKHIQIIYFSSWECYITYNSKK